MALHFDLHVNGQSINEGVTIQRINNFAKRPSPHATFDYLVTPASGLPVVVRHRYGDGAMELARKALNKLAETNRALS